MDLIQEIESLRYDIENGIETDVIKISVRLIQIKEQALQLQQTDVSISLERAKKYARHQYYVGTQQREFVEFEDWAKD